MLGAGAGHAGGLSRRDLFRRTAAAGVATAAAGLLGVRAAMAQGTGRVVDMTHAYDGDFPTYDGSPGILYEPAVRWEDANYQLWKLTIYEHTGTHIDAPLHFSEDGTSVDALEPASLICPLCVVDISAKAADDPNATVAAEDIEAWISANGDIPPGALVAMHSGWADRLDDATFRTGADGALAFPGFAKDATDMLLQMQVAGIGVDTLSLDPGNSADFAVHNSWLPSGRYGIECLANLGEMPASGATIFVGAPKHRGGTGGPARVMAML